MRTLVIGRSPYADVVIADPSVASRHAELVVTAAGRFFLTDCASETGSWRRSDSDSNRQETPWVQVRQAFVASDQPLRLGDHHCTAAALLQAARQSAPADAAGRSPSGDPGPARPHRLRGGRVERDAVTGEIVRRRP